MRTIFFAGIVCLCLLTSAEAQTAQPGSKLPSAPAPTQTTTPLPSAPAPTPAQGTVLSAPVPTPTPSDQIESKPAYGQQQATPQTAPTPTSAPQPVVTEQIPSAQAPFTAKSAYGSPSDEKPRDTLGSAYIPVDSWVYPAMMRLYSMGYVDTMYLSMRPYTRRSVLHMLDAARDSILAGDDDEAKEIYASVMTEIADEGIAGRPRGTLYGVHSVYTRVQGIGGSVLSDSFHLGQTYFNDYGRPHQPGFNNITGFSTLNESGPFSLYVRGEYQHAPSGRGYSEALSSQLSLIDTVAFTGYNNPQDTIPTGPIAGVNTFRLVEGTLSYHILGHEISGGKSDAWLGPGMGSSMAWGNNAENIYSFRINRVEPLNIKYLSKLLGPVRYDFFYGSLKGHTAPNDDWTHSEMFSFRPTKNFEFGFQRTIVFGGKGHQPVTMHTFLKGFFDTNDTAADEKLSRNDPGARFSAFNFSYRLPFVRRYLTLYTDSETHDDLTPISAPRRASYRPGIYLSHFPFAEKLDLRVEGVSTDCATLACLSGANAYTEHAVQIQAYTNKGIIMADWIGREAKGGQAWLTWHLSSNEWVQLMYLHKKTAKDFIPGGTTQNQFVVDVMKRVGHQVEIHGWYQWEGWKAPVYKPGAQTNNTVSVQVTFFPRLQTTAK